MVVSSLVKTQLALTEHVVEADLPPPWPIGGTLVTHNVSEFERVEGLRQEDWAGS